MAQDGTNATMEQKMDLTRLPKLPREYFDRSGIMTTLFLVYAFCTYALPVAAIYWIVGYSPFSVPEKTLLTVALAFVAQQGLHLFGWIGHEGLHFNLVRNRRLSAFLGLSFSSMIFSHMGFGFALSHWNHHRFANRPEDPDRQIFEQFHTALERLLFARLVADWHYLVNGVLAAFGKLKIDTKGFPLSQKEQQAMAWLNILLATAWAGVYAWMISINPVAGLAAIALPHLLVVLLTGLRPYLEHAGTEPELFRTSRTRISPLLSTVYFFNNYHLEHHLYPKVPCYNLPRVHRYLKSKGYFEMANSFIEEGSLANLKYATARFQYASSPSETLRTLDTTITDFAGAANTSPLQVSERV